MLKEIGVTEIYEIKNAAEAEMNDILKGFTIATGMDVEGVEIMAIPTKEDKINTYYKTRLIVRL